MTSKASVAELLNAGLKFEADEAVAIAQQLIDSLNHAELSGHVEPPYGPPDVTNVFLEADGSVRCNGCGTTPTVSEVAIFLDTLLPPGSPRVPGGLRYTIARGLLDVDVAPFDSLEEFAATLARHERGARDAIVRAVLERADNHCTALMRRPPDADRRFSRTTVADLRRELRHADARLYQLQVARASSMMSSSVVVAPRRPTAQPVAACLAAGFLLIAAGELMHSHHWMNDAQPPVTVAPEPVPPTEPADVVEPVVAKPAVEQAEPQPSAPRPISASQPPSEPPRADAKRAEPVRIQAKRPIRPSGAVVHRVRAQRQPPGVMDRLGLGWLRSAFKQRS